MQRQVGPAHTSLYAQLSILLAFAFVVMTVLVFWMANKADALTEENKVLRWRIYRTAPMDCALRYGCAWKGDRWEPIEHDEVGE